MLDFIGTVAPSHATDVAAEALDGLTSTPKTLPAKLFYDEAGCRLFEQITELPEYYLTRTERTLLSRLAPEIGEIAPAGAALVEYGASSETKARVMLAALRKPRAYVPIDIAAPALAEIVERMSAGERMSGSHANANGPTIQVAPVAADFLSPVELPDSVAEMPRLGFFPGSTIGNLAPDVAVEFLGQARDCLGPDTYFVVGADVRKDPAILIPAYDDAAGVTAAFNKNLLVRLNREADAEFDPECFRHEARWNDAESRIEMHLVSTMRQSVRVAGRTMRFADGESIHTENSYKHTIDAFQALAERAGWWPVWAKTDPEGLFAIHLLHAGNQR